METLTQLRTLDGTAGWESPPQQASTARRQDRPQALTVDRLGLTEFRCYASQRLETGGRSVVLTGTNGAGKTNLLEAVSLLVPGRGLRRARLSDIARLDANGRRARQWAVAVRVNGPAGPLDIGTGCRFDGEENERRQIRIDGVDRKSQSALADHVSAVWLTPRMDGLFLDSASVRRRFLDRLVFGFDPAHSGRLNAWEQAARDRSRLLRQGIADRKWLAALEDTMARKGVAVAAARLDLLARLNQACDQGIGPFPAATLALQGNLDQWLSEGPALLAEDRLRETLEAARPRDAETGGAGEGPHRSDLRVGHRAKNMPAEMCSTGEQKALLIAIILADARMQTAERGSPPLLLMDEVVAHLDARHRQALFGEIHMMGAQAWLTGTDRDLFQDMTDNALFVHVDGGQLYQH